MTKAEKPKRPSRRAPAPGAARAARAEPTSAAYLKTQLDAAQQQVREATEREAALAIENVRLFNETKEALAQQSATADVLKVISRSAFELQPVFESIVESAVRLCSADNASLFRHDGEIYRHVASAGDISDEDRAYLQANRLVPSRSSVTGRVALERRSVQIPDLRLDPEYTMQIGGNTLRAFLGVPIQSGSELLGVIVARRFAPGAFSDTDVKLLETFADQAAIAIENVRLLNETKQALERQTAISEILRVISRSPTDQQPVLDAIAESAARFCAAEDAKLLLEHEGELRAVAHSGAVPGTDTSYAIDDSSLSAYVFTHGEAFRVADMLAPEIDARFPSGAANARVYGWRSAAVVPLRREGRSIGTLNLRRLRVEPFTDKQLDLLRTFADQAAIAIENVRLFNETKEALERQTATANLLDVISRSAFEIAPVLQTIADSSLALCRADHAVVWQRDGNEWFYDATAGDWAPNAPSRLKRRTRQPGGGSSTVERAIEFRRTVHLPDVLEDPQLRPGSGTTETRTRLAVPILKDGEPIGAIQLGRREMEPFSESEIALVESFATQAAIAIENVRLFNETHEKSRQLEAASRHKSEFLANMSHELRTPLNAVIGFSDVLEQRMFGELNERQAEYVRDISGSGRHLLDLVNEILDLSKVEAGRMELESSEFALAETIRGAVGSIRERAARHGITLTPDVPNDLGTLVADERKVRQVLLNLLSNAVKFTPNGGQISVRAHRADGEIQVSVRDTGIGIAPEDQPRVFEEFQQVGKPTERSREGTGLGLTLAKRFVELHGGRIWLESEIGKGTTFTFAIPTDGDG